MERSQLVRVGVGSREVSDQSEASFEQVFWRAAKNSRVNPKSTKPTKLPVSKKTAQSDVTAKTALKSPLKKHSEFRNKTTLLRRK